MIALLPFLVALLGLFLYFLPAPIGASKVNEVGRILFFCAALVLVARYAGHTWRLP